LDYALINQICKKFLEIKSAEPANISGLMKLQNINGGIKSIEKEILETLDNAKSEIYNIVESAARDYYAETAKHREYSVPFDENHAIMFLVGQTKQEIYQELTKILDLNGMGFTMPDGGYKNFEQAYHETINGAIKNIINQSGDIDEYIKVATDNLTEHGLSKRILPQNGDMSTAKTRNIEASFEMEMRYRLTQMQSNMAEILAKEMGATGYEIDWHSGYRPEHDFGGKQFTFEEMETKGINDKLLDYNCLHYKIPVIVGVTPPRYSVEKLAELEATELVRHKWGGKEYTLYELTQVQNRYKRSIERQEREIAAILARGQFEDRAYMRLERLLEKYDELSELIERLNGSVATESKVDDENIVVTDDINTADQETQMRYIWDYIINNWKLTEEQAAAIMGNICEEGDFSPLKAQKQQDGRYPYDERDNSDYISIYDINDGIGWGICQWTFNTRKQALLDYAKEKRTGVGDMDTQLEFLYLELTKSGYSGGGSTFVNMFKDFNHPEHVNDIDYLTEFWMKKFENPDDQSQAAIEHRIGHSRDIYEMFRSK